MSPVIKKGVFCICENKDAVTAKLISTFVSATRLERFIYFLNSKISSLFPSSVGPGQETPNTGFLMTRLNYGKTRVHCICRVLVLASK